MTPVPGGAGPPGATTAAALVRVGTLPAQVDPTTCAIAALAAVAARAGAAPTYLGATRGSQVRAQQRLHAVAARTGVPWPESLGTAPWALARLAHAATGEAWCVLPWGRGARAAVLEANDRGRDAFVYVGGGPNALPAALVGAAGPLAPLLRRLGDVVPRHVVAVLATPAPTPGVDMDEGVRARVLEVFEPSSGTRTRLSADTLDGAAPLPGAPFGNWPRPLIAVVPRAPGARRRP